MLNCVELILASIFTVIVKLTKDQMFHERTKHIDIKFHFVRDVIEEGELKVCKISTHDNPADMLTMLVPVTKFELCSSLVGLIDYPKRLFWCQKYSLFVIFRMKVLIYAIRGICLEVEFVGYVPNSYWAGRLLP